jgi:CrcB protein
VGISQLLLVGVGGFIGSIARYVVSGSVQGLVAGTFPVGTFAVNVFGCFGIGGVAELVDVYGMFSPETRALLVIGLFGGFTTFSTFGNETVNLIRAGDWSLAAVNVAAHMVLAIGAVWLGRAAVVMIWR